MVGTGNKVEDYGVGFYTKYGDGGVDIAPIADLYKTEVWELGKHLGVDQRIIDAQPTDGLWEDGTQFGMNTLGAGVMTGAMNNAFREVAIKFALVVADKAYGIGYDIGAGDEYDRGYVDGVESVRSGVLGD